ncbi:MAG: HAD-IA family hydrolase [Hyphomicrobium sp.]|nr:HAD-IA family hydrolase [Hyphomicrobium sp.]
MRDLTVAFDLDGTLVETAPDLIAATNHVLAAVDLAPVAPELIRPSISFGAAAMIKEGFRLHGREIAALEAAAHLERFLAYYRTNIAATSHAFPGLEASLDRLTAEGARLAVCTNKQAALSEQLLRDLRLRARFAALAGRDTFPVCKPHPDHLIGAIRMAGGDPKRAIMVGDSKTDIDTAKAAGIPVVAVTFGYTDVHVRDLAPNAVIEHYDELIPAIERLIGR